MSAISNTARAGLAGRPRLSRRLMLIAVAVLLAATVLTAVLLASGGSTARSSSDATDATPQRLFIGGPGEGRGLSQVPASAVRNDGSQHPGRRP